MAKNGINAQCKDCECVSACKFAFGAFWVDKSHGGIGCRFPMFGGDKAKQREWNTKCQGAANGNGN